VAYVQSRPDPLTLLLDFRNVGAEGVANTVASTDKSPIAGVSIEAAESMGAPASRVRIALAQPVVHRVRSERNTIVVDFEKAPAKGVPYVLPPAASSSRGSTASDMPDAMMALRQDSGQALRVDSGQALRQDSAQALQTPTDSDPIAALGLDNVAAPPPAPQVIAAQGAPSSTAPQARANTAPPAARAVVKVSTPAAGSAAAPPPPQPQPQPPQPPVPTEQPGTGRKYTGHPISLDFQGADLRAVLRTFAEISGLNIVIDPAVQGTVDVALRDVPWDQALDIILRANKLGYVVDGTIVRVAPLAVLADEETQRRKLSDEQALSGELRVYTRSLSYARAEDLRPLLTATVLSSRGSIQTDPRTNTIIINDLPDRLQRAGDLIGTLDSPQPQVEIEARIVQTTRQFARTIGVQWGVNGRATNTIGNTTGLAFPNQGSITGRTGGTQGPPAPEPQIDAAATAVNLGVTGASSAIGLAMGSVNGALNLDLVLSALEKQGQGRLLSTPRVTTQNNVEAEMTQGVQIPIQTVANNTVTVTFKDAALTLKVTPQITAANTVIMRISLENAAPDYSKSVNNIPPIDTQRAITQVLVNNGDTTVIGGIYVSSEQTNKDGTPGLNRLPLLGWLFKREGVNDESRELLIFITPRILTL